MLPGMAVWLAEVKIVFFDGAIEHGEEYWCILCFLLKHLVLFEEEAWC